VPSPSTMANLLSFAEIMLTIVLPTPGSPGSSTPLLQTGGINGGATNGQRIELRADDMTYGHACG